MIKILLILVVSFIGLSAHAEDCVVKIGDYCQHPGEAEAIKSQQALAKGFVALQNYRDGAVFRCLFNQKVTAIQTKSSDENAMETCGVPADNSAVAQGAVFLMGRTDDTPVTPWIDGHCSPMVRGYRCEWNDSWVTFR